MQSTINLIYRDFSCQAFDTLEFPRGADAPQETSFHNLDTKSVKSARSTVRIRVNGTLEHSEHLVSLRLPLSSILTIFRLVLGRCEAESRFRQFLSTV